MVKNLLVIAGVLGVLGILRTASAEASDPETVDALKSKTAIVLANFGTTVPSGVQAIVNIQE
ncbi:MAG: hypothetical protein WAV08_13955, partial [Desulfobacterales bacterium]